MKFEIDIKKIVYRTFPLPTLTQSERYSDSLVYYTKGGHKFEYSDLSLTGEKGDLVYIPYKSSYTNHTLSENTEYYQVDFLIGDSFGTKPLLDKPRVFSQETSEKCHSYFYDLYHHYSKANREYDSSYFVDLMKIIDCVCHSEEYIQNNTKSAEKIEKTIQHINEYYYLDTSLKDLAAMSFMSISSLEKLFISQVGISPIAYRNKVRIEQAKLLLSGGYSVTDTATKVGYKDIYYFCRIFKNRCGISPGKYALNHDKV